MHHLRLLLLAAVAVVVTGNAIALDRIERVSARNFDETVQHLRWAFGGYGMTIVIAMDYQQILTKMKVETRRAVMFEVMRRDWVKTLLHEDPKLGSVLPLRLYVFEDRDGRTLISYQRMGSAVTGHDSEGVRALARQLDDKLDDVVMQATRHGAGNP
jgi:uncharacterized protein (DUF302 family)